MADDASRGGMTHNKPELRRLQSQGGPHMREIPLSKGYTALVDDEDFERVNAFKWSAALRVRKGGRVCVYGKRQVRIGAKKFTILLHNFILGVKPVDHKDGDGLNNARNNLRAATCLQNNFNMKKAPGKSSRFKGVWRGTGKAGGRWIACIKLHGKPVHCHEFYDEVDAATAYNFWALELFGEFAVFNLPEREHGRV